MTIGERMKNRRKELKLSADELGARLGKNRSTIYRYENGDIENLPFPMLEPIAKALEMDPRDLVDWEYSEQEEENKKNSDAIADITKRMFEDQEFFYIVNFLQKLDRKQFNRVKVSLSNLFEEAFDVLEN